MSLASPYQEHYYVADGVTTSFSFGEYFTGLSQAYVKCIIYFDDGTNCVPTFTVDMTTGFITIVTLTKPDGTVLTVPPAGSIVRVFRDTPEQQNVTASQLQNYTAKQLERIFDSVVAMIQEVSYSDLHKTIRLTETQRDVSMEQLKEENDQAILYWDFETRQLKATDYGQNQVVKSDTVDRLVYLQPEGKIYFIPKGSNNPIAIGSATIHNDLSGRNAPDCHPESAITNLTTHLQELRDADTALAENVQTALNRSQEAKDTAGQAKETAEYAQTVAGDAKDIAEDAKDIAEGIEDIANDAKDIAEDAKETAEGIDEKAQEALDNSEEALDKVTQEITDREDADEDLQDQIDNLSGRGRFLALWNCATGLAESNPPESPYLYKAGDYFVVGTVSSADPAVNYKPDGSSYTTGVASTTVETNEVSVNDTYFYDGTTWKLQSNAQKEVSFSALAGSPYDNTALGNALNDKVTETSTANKVYGTDNNGDQTTYNTTDFGAVDDVQVNNVSVVTSKIANIDLTNYVTLSTTQAITGTKTFKSEILSWNNITFESAQANPIIRGMSGASHRNMITRTNSASAIDVGNTSDTINLKGSGTRPTYNNNDLALYSDVPSLTGYIQNTATGTDSLTVLGTAASSTNSVNIGTGAGASGNKAVSVGDYASAEGEGSIAIGGDSSTTYRARATHKGNIAFGHDAYAINGANTIAIGETAHAQGANIIQLGTGNNTTANTFQVRSYTLLDTSTGLIPDARISTNITRTADLATVATSGSYNDLLNKPTIPAAQVNSDWNANSGVAQILNKPTLAAVATSGNYSDLVGKPTIPTVNNPTITITQGGVTKGSFTLNQASGDTIALDAGGGVGNIDNITITTNADSEIQAVAVIDQNTGIAKTWTGTMAEYDAIVTKDPATEYIITDDIGGSATEIGQITEALNDKVDKGHQVIEFQEPTAANNYTWYRKYADGWVEIGGIYTVASGSPHVINLPVTMADTNYSISATAGYSGTGDSSVQIHIRTDMITTTTFAIQKQWTSSSGYYYWQVSGMAA